jgi:predicted house-cleaning noncanonical NTP pyrophosphatase (MazG superfamily)
MIKNWLVKTKQIKLKEKGFLNHVNYLTNDKKPSHEHSLITVLNDSAENILKEHDQRKTFRRENGLRGGGVSNFSTSLVMSLPRCIKQPTNAEWKKIGLYTIKEIAKKNNIDFQKLKNVSHIVLHDENSSVSKSSHLHILISNVIDNKVVKGISQKKTTFTAKKAFNYSVKKLINEDNNHYIPENKKVKDKPLFAARAEKAEKVMLLFINFKDVFNDWFNAVINKKDSFILSTLAKKSACAFNDFDHSIENKSSSLPNKILSIVEEVEEFTTDNELAELPAYKNLIKPLEEVEKISPKTTRKKRSRSATPKHKLTN